MKICIIDTGSANLNSVNQAVKRLGVSPEISNDLEVLASADKLILPGVGSAISVMNGVRKYNLKDFILNTKKPLLGICLGMQIQAKDSEEVPLGSSAKVEPTLGIVDGHVHKLQTCGLTLPHMGWNTVKHTDHPLFDGIKQDAFFYFDHSFALDIGEFTIGECEYGERFTAASGHNNFLGVQFHPEKSGAAGAALLSNFIHNFEESK